MKLKLSKYVLISEALDSNEGPTGKRMIFSTRKSMGISVTNYVVELCQNNDFSVLPNNLFNILMFHEIVVPADQEETDELIKIKGIIGDDVSEINEQLIIDLENYSNDQTQHFLNQQIEHISITPKTKKLSVFLQAPIEKFSLEKSNLQQIQSFFDARTELQKIQIEFNLICGIPIDESIENADLSWIENIHIIHFANSSKQNFVDALSQLERFAESVKLKMKLNVRFIFDRNFVDKIKDSQHLLNSIKYSTLRFSLSKANFDDLDSWEIKELELLQTLDACGIQNVQLPEVTQKYLNGNFEHDPKFHYDFFEDFALEVNDNNTSITYKSNLTSDEINSFRTKSPSCYSCLFLFMCGGKMNKDNTTNMDCPDFRSNIMFKARMKYKI